MPSFFIQVGRREAIRVPELLQSLNRGHELSELGFNPRISVEEVDPSLAGIRPFNSVWLQEIKQVATTNPSAMLLFILRE